MKTKCLILPEALDTLQSLGDEEEGAHQPVDLSKHFIENPEEDASMKKKCEHYCINRSVIYVDIAFFIIFDEFCACYENYLPQYSTSVLGKPFKN